MRDTRRGTRLPDTRHRLAGTLVLLCVATTLVRCGGTLDDSDSFLDALDPPPPDETETESCANTQPAFLSDTSQCAACHVEGGIAPEPEFVSPGLADRLLNTVGNCPAELLVDPANPEQSTMVRWMRGGIEGCTVSAMPPNGVSNSDEDINCLLEWIDALDGTQDLTADATP